MFVLDDKHEAELREMAARDLEVKNVLKDQKRFSLVGERSAIAPANGLWPGEQQYTVRDSETNCEFIIVDRRKSVSKTALADDVRKQLTDCLNNCAGRL